MDKDPVVDIKDDDRYPESAELITNQEEKGSGRRKVIVIVIIILLLLLLFWPVDPAWLKRERDRLRKERAQAAKERPIGKAKYAVVSSAPMAEIDNSSPKAIPVGVWFVVQNVSSRAEVLDFSMVSLKDQHGVSYTSHAELTELTYEQLDQASPWEETVAPGGRVKALAMFYVFRGPVKKFFLVGRDFEWVSQETKEYPAGEFETMGGRWVQ